jgi:hypothetical protein
MLDNEREDLSLENAEKPRRAAPSGWQRPLQIAGLGLVLMLGGYAAMNYVPPIAVTPRQAAQERTHSDMRQLAARPQAGGTAEDALVDRLDEIKPPWRTPPYQIPGRLALYAGLILFVTAGVLMYRHSPPNRESTDDEIV